MRIALSLVLLCSLSFAACQAPPVTGSDAPLADGLPAAGAPSPMPAAPSPAPATLPDLALHLAAGNVTPADLLPDSATREGTALDLREIPLQAEPLLTLDDIVAYDAATHVFTLTTTATERLAGLPIPVAGPAFVLMVDGDPIYAGAFWTPLSSLSYDGVVIMLMPDGQPAFGSYRIELGYPGPGFFQGDDPRGDPRVLDALRQGGKLVP